ncbi:family 20 glycosylhydrolase [Longispora albida]|uniref:family 20 glycosylhydrolase n=1 Tax=Longispora albida TaxID=203523 RepID=UPI00037D5948|nr:family 20 glycosylhydrolase [Longispora albida]
MPILRSFALAAVMVLPSIPGQPVTAGPPPQTVPALQEWKAEPGNYTFGPGSRVVVDPAHAAELAADAALFAEDLQALTRRPVTVTREKARAGDIVLTLGGSGDAEGYTMRSGSTVTIQGRASTGVFYGTRTVLQLLKQGNTIPAGTARDWPEKPERGLMIDQGRKFFSVDWVKRHIRELAYLKLNTFHFHLSDSQGFRLESTSHPEVVSAQRYTKAEMAELIALAARYHVTVIPEIDMPGHMNAVLTPHPELQLRTAGGTADPYYLDLSKEGAYVLASELINEYLPLFPGPYWHVGADEYVLNYGQYPQLLEYARSHYGAEATAKDTYYGFVNWVNDLVRAQGKTLRMWNDGIKNGDGAIEPHPSIVVDYWFSFGLSPQQLLDRGHVIANQSWTPTYYVLGGQKPDTQWMYETWRPGRFEDGQLVTMPSRNRGTMLHVWCDNPDAETEDQIAAGIRYPLRALAQGTWGSPKPVASYADFVAFADRAGRVPGFQGSS